MSTITKYDNSEDADHYVFDMLVSSDGGILLGGYVIANYIVDTNGYFHRNDAWLAKMDSCGFTVGDIPEPNILIDSIIKRTVYLRETSQNYCTAQLSWGDDSDNINYYAYENNLPLSEKQFSHTFVENGTYTINAETLAGEEFRSYSLEIEIKYQDIDTPNPTYGIMSIFPNPAKEILTIQNPLSQTQDLEIFSIEMYSINGKLLKKYNLNEKLYQQQIDITSITNGVYYVKFVLNNHWKETVKMVVAK